MNTATITIAFDPVAGGPVAAPDLPVVTIDTRQVAPIEGRLIGKTFYEAMERFYSDPNNCRRFKKWQNERRRNGKGGYCNEKD